ncbi:Uncharacterised protein [uncultured archaeon]|nr:Uncharacterised protein [uncultured archaeon]
MGAGPPLNPPVLGGGGAPPHASLSALAQGIALLESDKQDEKVSGALKVSAWLSEPQNKEILNAAFGRGEKVAAGAPVPEFAGALPFSGGDFAKVLESRAEQVKREERLEGMRFRAEANKPFEQVLERAGFASLDSRGFAAPLDNGKLLQLSTHAVDIGDFVESFSAHTQKAMDSFAQKQTKPKGDAALAPIYDFITNASPEDAKKFREYLDARVAFETDLLANGPPRPITLSPEGKQFFEHAKSRIEAEVKDGNAKSADVKERFGVDVTGAMAQQAYFDAIERAVGTGGFAVLAMTVADFIDSKIDKGLLAEKEKADLQSTVKLLRDWSLEPSATIEEASRGRPVQTEIINSLVEEVAGIPHFTANAEVFRKVPLATENALRRPTAELATADYSEDMRKLLGEVNAARAEIFPALRQKRAEERADLTVAALSAQIADGRMTYINALLTVRKKLEQGMDLADEENAVVALLLGKNKGGLYPPLADQAIVRAEARGAIEREISNLSNSLIDEAEATTEAVKKQIDVRMAFNSARLAGQLPKHLDQRYKKHVKDIAAKGKQLDEAKLAEEEASQAFQENVLDADLSPEDPNFKFYEDKLYAANSKVMEYERALGQLEYDLYKTGCEFEYILMEARIHAHQTAREKTLNRRQELLEEFPEFEAKYNAVRRMRSDLGAYAKGYITDMSEETKDAIGAITGKGKEDAMREERHKRWAILTHALRDSTVSREDWYNDPNRKWREKAEMVAYRYGLGLLAGPVILSAILSPAIGIAAAMGGAFLLAQDKRHGGWENREHDYLYTPTEKLMYYSQIITERASGTGFTIYPEKSIWFHRQPYRAVRVVKGKVESKVISGSGYGTSVSTHAYVFGAMSPIVSVLKVVGVRPSAWLREYHGILLAGGRERWEREFLEPASYSLAIGPEIVGTQMKRPVVVSVAQFRQFLAESQGVRRQGRRYFDRISAADAYRLAVGAETDQGPLSYPEPQEAKEGAVMPRGFRKPQTAADFVGLMQH